MKQRLFIAVKTTGETKNNIIKWQKNNSYLPVRIVEPVNLHMTIIPPFYEPKEKIAKILKKHIIRIHPFTLTFTGISAGPDSNFPKLIWITGITDTRLTGLKSELEYVLKLKPEKRKLIPHITLARIKKQNTEKVNKYQISRKINWKMEVNSFALMISHLTSNGADYETAQEFRL